MAMDMFRFNVPEKRTKTVQYPLKRKRIEKGKSLEETRKKKKNRLLYRKAELKSCNIFIGRPDGPVERRPFNRKHSV